MYVKGDVKLSLAEEPEYNSDEWFEMYDRGDKKITYDANIERGQELPARVVFLPHSCEEWVIGGRAEVSQLIHDLYALLEDLELI